MARAYVEPGSWTQNQEPLPLESVPAQSPSGRPHRVAQVLAKLIHRLKPHVPAGYEDETGFHYGAEPPRDRPSI